MIDIILHALQWAAVFYVVWFIYTTRKKLDAVLAVLGAFLEVKKITTKTNIKKTTYRIINKEAENA